MFLFISSLAMLISLFSYRSKVLFILSAVIYAVSILFRPEIGPDYRTYLDIYNSSFYEAGQSGSILFDILLTGLRELSLPYKYACLLPLCISFFPFFAIRDSSITVIFYPLCSSIAYFNLLSVNITKSSLSLSLLSSIILPAVYLLLISYQSNPKKSFHIATFALIVSIITFFIQPPLVAFFFAFLALVAFSRITVPSLGRFLISLRIKTGPFLKITAFISASLFFAQSILKTDRYSFYLENSSAYLYTEVASAFLHALPFILAVVLIYSGNINPLIALNGHGSNLSLQKLLLSLPLAFSALLFVSIDALGMNVNIVGRLSILYGLLFMASLVATQSACLYRYAILYPSRWKIITLVVTCPTAYRAISSFKYSLSLT